MFAREDVNTVANAVFPPIMLGFFLFKLCARVYFLSFLSEFPCPRHEKVEGRLRERENAGEIWVELTRRTFLPEFCQQCWSWKSLQGDAAVAGWCEGVDGV